jgi:CspA family cold shock protein
MNKTPILKGVVKFYNPHKGYGFIRDNNGHKDVFVHFSSIKDNSNFRKLTTGDTVSFETRIHPKFKKEQAFNVRISQKF